MRRGRHEIVAARPQCIEPIGIEAGLGEGRVRLPLIMQARGAHAWAIGMLKSMMLTSTCSTAVMMRLPPVSR